MGQNIYTKTLKQRTLEHVYAERMSQQCYPLNRRWSNALCIFSVEHEHSSNTFCLWGACLGYTHIHLKPALDFHAAQQRFQCKPYSASCFCSVCELPGWPHPRWFYTMNLWKNKKNFEYCKLFLCLCFQTSKIFIQKTNGKSFSEIPLIIQKITSHYIIVKIN